MGSRNFATPRRVLLGCFDKILGRIATGHQSTSSQLRERAAPFHSISLDLAWQIGMFATRVSPMGAKLGNYRSLRLESKNWLRVSGNWLLWTVL